MPRFITVKRIEMQQKLFYPLTDYAPSGVAQTPSGKAQPYLPLRSLRSLGLRARILSRFAPSAFALAFLGRFAPSGFALHARYLPYDTPRVPRNVHAKLHANRTKTVGARGIHTYIHRYIHT